MKVAAIDCGTNSMRLLIAARDADGRFVDLFRGLRTVRLGQGVDRAGVLSQEALDRAFTAGREYAALMARHGVFPDNARCVATSAVRDARNKQEFLEGMREALGVEPDIISGLQEAELSFNGAMRTVTSAMQNSNHVLVLDIGGGSTELVVGSLIDGAGSVAAAVSVDIGCVRMKERFITSDPPRADEVSALRAAVAGKMEEVTQSFDLTKTQLLVGVSGTITTVTAAILGLDVYDSGKINGAAVTIGDIIDVTNKLAKMSCSERKNKGYVHPGRVDVLSAGALIYQEIIREIAKLTQGGINALVTSEYDILDGAAWSIVG